MNTNTPDNPALAEDKTVVAPRRSPESRTCPVCGTANEPGALQKRDYRCAQCNLELAHLDYAPNGAIRGVFGWLLAPGDVALDRYRIKSVLGKGGFGAAYLVDDLQLSGKRRALKEVPEMLFDEYETSLLSRLDHPAIPDIIERRTANGMVYLSLKFGGSRTLGSERKQYPDRRVPMEKLFPWMRQLCEVLVYLHSQTPPIIHRDLKPDNILLNEDERIMLVDFGIAKESVPEAMTRTLGRAATYGFSPPEQVMGTGTDERSDIYALGATFYALLTGQNPPPAHERVAGAELVPPSQFIADVPPEVEEAIIQSLSLNMNHRQRSVREFALSLGGMDVVSASRPTGIDWAPTGEPGTSPLGNRTRPSAAMPGQATAQNPPAARRNAALILAAVLTALAAIATGAYFYFNRPAQPVAVNPVAPPAKPTVAPPVQQQPPTPAIVTPTPEPAVTPASETTQKPPTPQPQTPEPPPVQPAAQTPAPPTATPTTKPEGENVSPTPAPKAQMPGPKPKAQQAQERPVPVPQAPKPKPKPANTVRPHSAAPVERSSPKPSGGAAPSWSIIPGGAHKTD